jgi:hypothetical protein
MKCCMHFFSYFHVSHIFNYHELNKLSMCYMVTLYAMIAIRLVLFQLWYVLSESTW